MTYAYLAFVDEALAGGVGVQAAEQPVAVMLVDVVPVLGEGAARGGRRHRAAFVAQHGEVAVERAARVQDHVDAGAVGQRVAQRVDRRVEHLHLHVLAAQKAARAHHHVRRHDVHALVGLQALHHAILDDDLFAGRAVQKLAARGLDGLHQRRDPFFALALEVMAGAEPVAVHVGPQRHGHAQVDHRVEGVTGACHAVAQQRAVHAGAREVVHVGEQRVQRDRLAFLLLQLRLARRRTAAHREVRHGRRGRLLHDDDLLARLGQLEGSHEARRARADDDRVAFLRAAAFLARDALLRLRLVRGCSAAFACGRGPVLLRRAAGKPGTGSQRAHGAQAEKRAAVHRCVHDSAPPCCKRHGPQGISLEPSSAGPFGRSRHDHSKTHSRQERAGAHPRRRR